MPAARRTPYALVLQCSLVLTLVLLIALFRAPVRGSSPEAGALAEPEPIPVLLPPPTEHRKPPPPALPPPVPTEREVTDDPVVQDVELRIQDEPTVIGAPPNPPNPPAEPEVGAATPVFEVVEHAPMLIGGLAALQQRIRYPELARRAGIEGTVFVQFIVDEEGRVVDPVVVRGIGGGCDEEALRAIGEARFEPGRQRGRAVRVRFTLPVRFRLR
jgi:periplasmic protein TonB